MKVAILDSFFVKATPHLGKQGILWTFERPTIGPTPSPDQVNLTIKQQQRPPIMGTDAAQPGPQADPSTAADSSATPPPPRHPEGALPVHNHHRRHHTPPRERVIPQGQTTSSKRPPALPRRKLVKWDLKINMMNKTANQALQRPTHHCSVRGLPHSTLRLQFANQLHNSRIGLRQKSPTPQNHSQSDDV